MMFCATCGSSTQPINGHCPACGGLRGTPADTVPSASPVATLTSKRLRTSRPNEGDPASTNPSASTYCGRCGSAVSATNDFCGICGNPLNEATMQRMRLAIRQKLPPTPAPPVYAVPSISPASSSAGERESAAILRIFAIIAICTFVFLLLLVIFMVIGHHAHPRSALSLGLGHYEKP